MARGIFELLAAEYLARVVGLAHARQMEATRASYVFDLQSCRSKTLDAPSWL